MLSRTGRRLGPAHGVPHRGCFPASLRSAIAGRGWHGHVPSARVAHIGLYRDHKTLQAIEYYFKAPEDIADRLIVVVDPMLATANSAIAAVEKLKGRGATQLRFVCLLAAPEGIKSFTGAHPDVPVFTAAIDSHLNEKGYIVPGLGDAGDRMYGTK